MQTAFKFAAIAVIATLLAACGAAPSAPQAARQAAIRTASLADAPGALAITALAANGAPGTAFSIWTGDVLTFTAQVVNAAKGTTYAWTTNATNPSPTNQAAFKFPSREWGEFSVSCTVTDKSGATAQKAARVVIYPHQRLAIAPLLAR